MTIHMRAISELSRARVLVIGDVMLDSFCYGSVSRISPEAPVPVISLQREVKMLGGAGNVLANLASLSAQCSLIGLVGTDHAGMECKKLVSELGADETLLISDSDRTTTLKTRYISGSQQLLRCDTEDVAGPSPASKRAITRAFDSMLPHSDAVVMSDYAKGVLDDQVITHILEKSSLVDVPVIVDPKRVDLRAYKGSALIKPNKQELEKFVGGELHTLTEVEEAARYLNQETGAAILATLSGDGMLLLNEGETLHLKASTTEVYDVSGAGDTVISIVSAAIAVGLSLEVSAEMANIGAGLVVRKLGTATVTQDELEYACSPVAGRSSKKPLALEEAVRAATTWREQGLSVGFTNGCFDIVHAGHIRSLAECKKRCDRLIVGLNSDSSIARLKGPTRPAQDVTTRAAVLLALEYVDAVVVFEEDTPIKLIQDLKPTDLFKGGDYELNQIVGKDLVQSMNGRVHIIPLLDGYSTSATIRKIQAEAE